MAGSLSAVGCALGLDAPWQLHKRTAAKLCCRPEHFASVGAFGALESSPLDPHSSGGRFSLTNVPLGIAWHNLTTRVRAARLQERLLQISETEHFCRCREEEVAKIVPYGLPRCVGGRCLNNFGGLLLSASNLSIQV